MTGGKQLEVFMPGCTGEDGRDWEKRLAADSRKLALQLSARHAGDETRLGFEETLELVGKFTDTRSYRYNLGRFHCIEVNGRLFKQLGHQGSLKFKRLLCRREYNFGSDVIVASLPLPSVR